MYFKIFNTVFGIINLKISFKKIQICKQKNIFEQKYVNLINKKIIV